MPFNELFRKRKVGVAEDAENDVDCLNVRRSMFPMFVYLSFGGHFNWFGHSKRNVFSLTQLCFSVVIDCIVLFCLIMNIVSLPRPFVITISSVSNYMGIILYSTNFYACTVITYKCAIRRSSGLHKYLDRLQEFVTKEKIPNCRALSYINTACCFATLMLSIIVMWLWHKTMMTFSVETLKAGYPYLSNFEVYMVILSMRYFGVLLIPIIQMPSLFLVGFISIWTWLFKSLSDRLKLSINGEEEVSLSETRRTFERWLQLLAEANDMFSTIIGLMLSASIAMACLAVYYLKIEVCADKTLEYLFMCVSLFIIVQISIVCGLLSSEIHASSDSLYFAQFDRFHLADKFELHAFLLRLSCGTLGFSFYKLFTMDKAALLTLLGTAVSYMVVLYQMPTEGKTCMNVPTN